VSFAPRIVRILVAVLALTTPAFASFQGLAELEKRLADSDEKTRRAAVEELSRQNGVAAIQLVLASLRDPSPMVADEAQISLASADEPAEFELLFAKDGLGSKDDMVRLRCAEALGRIDAKLPSLRLSKCLGDKNPQVRRAMAWSIERLAGHLGIVESPSPLLRKELQSMADRDNASEVRAASVMALAALPPGLGVTEITAFAADKQFEVRSAALLAASNLDNPSKLLLARQGLKDQHPSVRLQAHALLARVANREAAVLLADALETEKAARPAWSLVKVLRQLSGAKAGREARYWQQWAKELAEDWKPGEVEARSPDPDQKTATFVGLPILSERITFLIDMSGSMWEERDDKTRKAGADKELERALSGLPASCEFNVIVFSLTPVAWEKELQPATPKNVADALAFFVKRKDQGKGNYWDAMQFALEDPKVDTLILLGDGAPTGGTRWNVELMRTLYGEQNRFRLAVLDAVLVDCSKTLTRTWNAWCESTGGRTLATDLR